MITQENDQPPINTTTTNPNDVTIEENLDINNNNKVATSAQPSSFSYFNPLTWLGYTSDNADYAAIEKIESKMFASIKSHNDLKRFYVNIRNESVKIWTVSVNTASLETPIVLIHGFCGAVAMWIHNIDTLSQNRPFYAFDLLGFGRSSRPNFSVDPIVAEQQFVESIEDWRKEMGLNSGFILMGHSFGGFISASYAIKYPLNVRALLLCDPWGFPEIPTNKADTPVPMWVSVIKKASQFVSPLAIFRVTGQVGIKIFRQVRPDFERKYMTILDNPEIIYNYLYHANSLHPSGEAGFRAISEYFGYAKNPMIKRIDKVDNNIPIWFIYGSRSWIDSAAGFTSMYIRQGSILTSVKLITGAGHHVYADRPNEFNEYTKYILGLIDDHEKSNRDYPNPT